MIKGYATYLLEVATAVLADHTSCRPQDREGCRRDISRLSSLVESRGLPVFTLDLPAYGKHFDRCLAQGRLTRCQLPLSRRAANEEVIPRLFQGLLRSVFDGSGMLKPDACIQSIATLRQLYYVGKKVEIDCEPAKAFMAIADFYSIEDHLPPPSRNWEGYDEMGTPDDDSHSFDDYHPRGSQPGGLNFESAKPVLPEWDNVVQQWADIISSTLGVFDPYCWRFKHGPGAVSDMRGKMRYKYHFPTWPEALEPVFPYASFAFANESLWADAVMKGDVAESHDSSSWLIMVPKTQKGPRLIAAEPTANQWCQQALLDYFATRIRETWIGSFIDFSNQGFNQDLARLASHDGSLWTVDLSAASDRLTCRFVERLFRKNSSLLRALRASRTRFLYQDLDKKHPSLLKLKKFSTMGSACTFPVQSIAFLCLVLSAMSIAQGTRPSIGMARRLSGRIRVFGDDIVIPNDGGRTLVDLLERFDFKVNADKTFTEGNFRESCGVEAFKGVDVTPAYVRKVNVTSKPDSVSSTVECSNNFFMKGWWRAADRIKSRVQSRHNILTVAIESGVFGFKSYCGTLVTKVLHDKALQQDWTPSAVVKTTTALGQVDHDAALLQYYTEAPKPDQMIRWSSGVKLRPRLRLQRGRAYLQDLSRIYVV